MSNHTETSALMTKQDLARGALEEEYRNRLRQWRDDEITDAKWALSRQSDKDFDRWCWRMGVP